MFDPFKHYYSIDDRSYFYFYLNDKDGNGVTSALKQAVGLAPTLFAVVAVETMLLQTISKTLTFAKFFSDFLS